MYPITYSFVIRPHQNFQSVKTAMTVAIHLLSVSNRDNIARISVKLELTHVMMDKWTFDALQRR